MTDAPKTPGGGDDPGGGRAPGAAEPDAAAWLADAEVELARAWENWQGGNHGKGRVGARRAAGMGLKAWLWRWPRPEYRWSFMHHLNALADDETQPAGARECAWRLAARPAPVGGFTVATAPGLTPMHDAQALVAWCRAELARGG